MIPPYIHLQNGVDGALFKDFFKKVGVNELYNSNQGCREVRYRISQPNTGITGDFDQSKCLTGQYFLTSYVTG